ncbi:MAG: DUF177 domain-containing protein [Actinomycetia bacterium]|nr:DUF177 domain-containing protein [Actinomycetes bacterium]
MHESAPRDLRIDVSEILEDLAGSLDVDVDIALDPIVVGSEMFAPDGLAHVELSLTYAGTAIIAQGAVAVDVRAVCVRCLREFILPISADVEGFYVREGSETELPEDQEYEFIQGESVDLLPAVRAALALDLPFAPLHDPACKGMCPRCGKDLSGGPCDCEPEPTDSPFAKLKELFPETDDHTR